MIVVLAELADGEADALVEAWGAEAVLLGVDALSRPGWVAEFPQAGPTFVADGQPRATRDLTGVLVRLPAVRAEHLPHIAEADRGYAAAEMTAFLAYWLSALECHVVNRPTPNLLMGPAWTVARWLTLARDLGIASAPEPGGPADRWVTAAGDRAFPAEDPAAPAAVALARQAGVSLLGLGFAGDRLVTVSLRPLLTSEVADAVLILLWGLAEDPPLASLRDVLVTRGTEHHFLDQRADGRVSRIWSGCTPRTSARTTTATSRRSAATRVDCRRCAISPTTSPSGWRRPRSRSSTASRPRRRTPPSSFSSG